MAKLDPKQQKMLRQLEHDLSVLDEKKLFNAMKLYRPYPKQEAFHAAGAQFTERLLRAANQVGKTYCGAMEITHHLTGLYPKWWTGRRWTRPTKWWASSKTGLVTRDGVQKYLVGEPGVVAKVGTGAIPKHCILDISNARGVDALLDTVQVQHYNPDGVKDGISIVRFKSYDQGREKWQCETLDGVWFDEEPPEDIYGEGTTRVSATGGMVYLTFTPLKGVSNIVKRYMENKEGGMHTTLMTMDDAAHFTAEKKAAAIARMLPHEREARSTGTPIMGEGRIFLCTEESIKCEAVSPLPRHWRYIWGLDFGGVSDKSHPFAAALLGIDFDADIIHIVACVRMKPEFGVTFRPLEHVQPMLPFGRIPVAWPQDGTAHESSGETLAAAYKKHGLNMLDEHATFKDGGLSTEAGISEMDERMVTGRWKVFSHLSPWFEEYRGYHREDGKIVKVDDDLLSASRVGMMMKRFARLLPEYDPRVKSKAVKMATDIDFNVLE